MKRKIPALLLALTLLPTTVFAEEDYFATELGEIGELLADCDASGIDTPYEDLGYSVMKKFAGYIAEDEKNGVSGEQLEYNKAYMTSLYEDVKKQLEAYKNNEKKPLEVTPYNMADFENFKSEGRSIYSIGYGHGTLVREDVEEMKNFGATNIQVETGPTSILTELPSFSVSKSDNASYTIENSNSCGNYLKAAAKDGTFKITQKVKVVPGEKYKISFKADVTKTDDSKLKVTPGGKTYSGDNFVYRSWKSYDFEYTAGNTENEVTFSITAEKITSISLDDITFTDSAGNNLLYNGDFEDNYDKKHIATLKEDLQRAYENNVTVCLLLSPHYFPKDLDVEGLYNDSINYFLNYNINLTEAKEIIKAYLDALLPEIKDCKAISSICLTNEPTFITWDFYDYYAPKFTEWLKKQYVTIDALNEAYGTSHTSFEDVEMPRQWSSTCVHYDWIRFNDENLTEWHEWLAGIVKYYLPDMPIHAKTMRSVVNDNKFGTLNHGAKPELFDSFSDWAGNDAGSYSTYGGKDGKYNADDFLMKMLWYDFLSSITDKPVYNSEDHLMPNKLTDFSDIYAKHSRAVLWQGMMHRDNMSSIWHWNRSYNSGSDAYNSVLHRPDCIYAIGKTALDLNRLSEQVDRITDNKAKAAIFYSQASRIYSNTYTDRLLEIYKCLVSLGQTVDFVMETDIDKLAEYDILIAGDAVATTNDAATAIKSFISDGGVVVSLGSNFAYDEYKKAVNYGITGMTEVTSENLYETVSEILEEKGALRVKLIDEDTRKPVRNIDWNFDIDGEDVLVNAMLLDGTKNIAVYVDGKKIETIDLLENVIFNGAVEAYVPVLLKTPEPGAKISKMVEIASIEGKTVTWTSGDEAYDSANIYRIKDGALELIKNTKAFSYTADDDNTVIIKACDSSGNESFGVAAGFAPDKLSVYISDGKAYVKNTTDKAQAGVLTIKLTDSDGNTLRSVYKSFVLRPNEKTSMRITLSAGTGQKITAGVSAVFEN